MKAIYLVFIIFFMSCSNPFGDNCNYCYESYPIDSAWEITASFSFKPDIDGYWSSPKEFEEAGGGDCEDFSTYMLYLLGPDSGARLAIIPYNNNNTIGFHAVIKLASGKLIEPQFYGMYYPNDTDIIWSLSYYDVMRYSTDGGRKSIIP